MSLTRKAFWLALVAAWPREAKAQNYVQTYVIEPAWKTGKAINNQCPVCGTMAEPYVYRDAGHLITCDHPRPGLTCVAPLRIASRTVRCERCNARFDQDAV